MIQLFTNSKWMAALVLALALGVLATVVGENSRQLRRALREQLIQRDGEIIDAVARAGDPSTNADGEPMDTGAQILLTLKLSKLKDDVFAARLFDARGGFVTAFPLNVTSTNLDAGVLSELQELRPASRFVEAGRLSDVLLMDPRNPQGSALVPLLEVNIPLRARTDPLHPETKPPLLGCAQLITDAGDLRRKLAALDHQLALQAAAVFLAAGALLTCSLVWGYRRLQSANHLLSERTARLLRANHELTLAAKTGSLGAVTAHLIHGLSNPLASLRDFISARGGAAAGEADWRDADAAARRMQQLVHEVVRVLGEGTQTDSYEISLAELAGILADKIQPLARARRVQCVIDPPPVRRISNHQANILLLILENLAHNAIEVTPEGKTTRLSFLSAGQSLVCEVSDEGPGFPESVAQSPFSPCRSTKGGAGLGLAISRQLARHLGAELELRRSGPAGSVVALALPPALFAAGEPVVVEAGRQG